MADKKFEQEDQVPENSTPGQDNGPDNVDGQKSQQVYQFTAEQMARMEKLLSEAEQVSAELEETKDKYLRLAAEYDNYRKRTIREREGLYDEVKGETIMHLLPVYDNLERALKQKTEDAAFYKGIEMTMNQLTEILTKLGVAEIPAKNMPFDPNLHNAVMNVDDPSVEKGVVIDVVQKGFAMGDKVLRFATVIVAN